MLVATGPGATALARTPCGPYMKATLLVMPTTACLEAVYAMPAADPRRDASEAMLTIDPCPVASSRGRAARISRMGPVALTRMTRSQVSSSISAAGRKPSMMPATLASPCSRPLAAATTALAVAGSAMSPATVATRLPGTASASSARRSSMMSVATTVAPSVAKRTAVARPIPDPAPVTMTVLPAKRSAAMICSCRREGAAGPRRLDGAESEAHNGCPRVGCSRASLVCFGSGSDEPAVLLHEGQSAPGAAQAPGVSGVGQRRHDGDQGVDDVVVHDRVGGHAGLTGGGDLVQRELGQPHAGHHHRGGDGGDPQPDAGDQGEADAEQAEHEQPVDDRVAGQGVEEVL